MMMDPPLWLVAGDTRAERLRRASARIRRWLSARHSLRAEALMVLAFYAAYEATRGFVVGDRRVAVDHAHAIASLEQRLHVFIEPAVQDAVQAVPELLTLLGAAYLTLHLSVTAGLLLWLHRHRPTAFARVRTTLLLASAIALLGFLLYPTAPPRMADVGVVDTISGRHVDLNEGLISSLYNPFAAVPSLHMGYALVVGAALARFARTRVARVAGIAYPLAVLVAIVATGNHFIFDAAAGAVVVVVAYVIAATISRTEVAPATSSVTFLAARAKEGRTERDLAA
jgi:type IV secretory pathway VirB3-like protein